MDPELVFCRFVVPPTPDLPLPPASPTSSRASSSDSLPAGASAANDRASVHSQAGHVSVNVTNAPHQLLLTMPGVPAPALPVLGARSRSGVSSAAGRVALPARNSGTKSTTETVVSPEEAMAAYFDKMRAAYPQLFPALPSIGPSLD